MTTDASTTPAAPRPAGGAQACYEAALATGRFEIQRCAACARHVFHPRQVCPHCGSLDLHWVQPSGLGTVYSTSTVRVDPKRVYEVCLIDLDEGVRLMSTVRNLPAGSVAIGQRVRAHVQGQAESALLVFDAVEAD